MSQTAKPGGSSSTPASGCCQIVNKLSIHSFSENTRKADLLAVMTHCRGFKGSDSSGSSWRSRKAAGGACEQFPCMHRAGQRLHALEATGTLN